VNLPAAFFVGGIWMLGSAIWQTFYRCTRRGAPHEVLVLLGIDVVPAVVLAIVIGNLA